MLRILDPTYTLYVQIKDKLQLTPAPGEVNITPGEGRAPSSSFDRRFHNGLTGKTGCDEVLAVVKKALADAGLTDALVTLERFEHT